MFGLSSLGTKLALAAVDFIIAAALGAWATHAIDNGRYNALVAAQARAQAQAVADVASHVAAADKITLANAVKEAQAQERIVTQYVTITKEIPAHVSDSAHCITYGLVRVFNAAAGTSAYPVPGAASKPDDACAPVTWRSFADDITTDYGAKAANDQQLGDLQEWVSQQQASGTAPAPAGAAP